MADFYTFGSGGLQEAVRQVFAKLKTRLDSYRTATAQDAIDTATREIITTVEASATASRNYAVGDYLILNGTLYAVTAAIASGSTITPGTNVTATTVMEPSRVAPDGRASYNHFGVCSTAAGTQAKTVTVPGVTELVDGVQITVLFLNQFTRNGSPTLNVNGLGAKPMWRRAGQAMYYTGEWQAGETLDLVYYTYNNSGGWVVKDAPIATTDAYGVTRLLTTATSGNTGYALTPQSLNSFAQGVCSPYPVYSSSSTYAVGDRVRYDFGVYECNTAITTAESWNAAHWTLMETLQEQIDDIDALIPAGASSSNKLATAADVPSVPSAYTSNPAALGTADPGSSGSWARGDHVHPAELPTVTSSDNGKVLRVVSGAWAAASLPSAAGVSFE